MRQLWPVSGSTRTSIERTNHPLRPRIEHLRRENVTSEFHGVPPRSSQLADSGWLGFTLRRGLALEYGTLAWNVVGTVILVLAAVAAGSVALSGFGVDSLIEIVASAVVVWQLKGEASAGREQRALRIIAIALVLLAIYIAVQATVAFASTAHPARPLAVGTVWLALTVLAMFALAAGKKKTRRAARQHGPAHRSPRHDHRWRSGGGRA